MDYIDLEPKTDREILMIIASKCNQMVDHLTRINDTLRDHGNRIGSLESVVRCQSGKQNWKLTLKFNWQTLSIVAALIALIIVELVKLI